MRGGWEMSYRPNSLKEVISGDDVGEYCRDHYGGMLGVKTISPMFPACLRCGDFQLVWLLCVFHLAGSVRASFARLLLSGV